VDPAHPLIVQKTGRRFRRAGKHGDYRRQFGRVTAVTFGGTVAANATLQNCDGAGRSAVLSKRQFADLDDARRCHDRNFEMIRLYDVGNVARAVRDSVDTGPAPQAIIEQSRAT
jgi:hypothetical protein